MACLMDVQSLCIIRAAARRLRESGCLGQGVMPPAELNSQGTTQTSGGICQVQL